jgi:cyclin B
MVVDQEVVATADEDEDGDDEMSDYSQITPEPTLMPWDESSTGDDLAVPEYAQEIMKGLKKQEKGESLANFMDKQKDINARMRTVLVDWLVEVHRKFKLTSQTYFLAINMVDRYLAHHNIARTKLQLLGCTCLWIASKYHEIYSPEMDDFVYISDNAFSTEQLTEMEVDVLKTLSFELTVPTVLSYAERYSKISSHYLKKEREMKIIADLIMYCAEHCVITYTLAQRAPSLLGAACFVLACLSTKVFTLEQMEQDNLEGVIGYHLNKLLPAMKELHSAVKNAKRSKHKALYKKYSSAKHSNIAKLNFARLNTQFLE